jgi:hypothetical protein
MSDKKKARTPNGAPSLHPVPFEEAVADLLKVKPERQSKKPSAHQSNMTEEHLRFAAWRQGRD